MTWEFRFSAESRTEALSAMPWMARLGSNSGKPCEGTCYGRRPLYAGYLMSQRDYQLDAKLERGEKLDAEESAYWTAMQEKSAKARDKSRCKLNARWIYVDHEGHVHWVCTHHIDQIWQLDEDEEKRMIRWFDSHCRRLAVVAS